MSTNMLSSWPRNRCSIGYAHAPRTGTSYVIRRIHTRDKCDDKIVFIVNSVRHFMFPCHRSGGFYGPPGKNLRQNRNLIFDTFMRPFCVDFGGNSCRRMSISVTHAFWTGREMSTRLLLRWSLWQQHNRRPEKPLQIPHALHLPNRESVHPRGFVRLSAVFMTKDKHF